ncbi:MAG: HIT family protein [Rhodothermales bacterium]|nr:HIT family protein [Rhodothermales bacterium]
MDGIRPCAFVFRNERVATFMNRAQYERGALLIVPIEHHETILELEPDLLAEVYSEAQRIAGGMVRALGAVGVNVFHNGGVRAGQTVSHLHVHVVPRYETSEPWKRFHTDDFEHTPVDELEEIAEVLRSALSA